MQRARVPHLVVATVLGFARREGYDVSRLGEELSFSSEASRWPGARVPWDDVVELFTRLEACAPDALPKFAAHYVHHFPILSWLATYVISPARLYRITFRAWARVWPIRLTVLGTERGFVVEGEVSPELRGGGPIFRVAAEILRRLPCTIGHEPASVELEAASHRCTWVVSLPGKHRGADDDDTRIDDAIFNAFAGDVFAVLAPPAAPGSWGLTRAEARVVEELVAGSDVQEIARRLCVDRETVRTHLKRAMAKASVRRQAELVARVLGSRDGA